jgi:hypothetical protein
MSQQFTTVKNEFTEVINLDDLNTLSTEYPVVLTETTLLESTTPLVVDDLIKQYDETFENKAEYQRFMEGKLGLWKNTMELKYFDGLYNEH